MALTLNPLLASRSTMSRSSPILHLCAWGACYGETFTFQPLWLISTTFRHGIKAYFEKHTCIIWSSGDRASWKFLIIKPTRCTDFSNLFLEQNSTCFGHSSFHHQEFFTLNTAVVYVIMVCWQLASRIRTELHPDPVRKLSENLYDIYHCCVYSEKLLMMDRGTARNM